MSVPPPPPLPPGYGRQGPQVNGGIPPILSAIWMIIVGLMFVALIVVVILYIGGIFSHREMFHDL